MKLIIVERTKLTTFKRLTNLFIDDINVEVILERRHWQRRQGRETQGLDRRARERRRLNKPWNGKDYIVIHIAE